MLNLSELISIGYNLELLTWLRARVYIYIYICFLCGLSTLIRVKCLLVESLCWLSQID